MSEGFYAKKGYAIYAEKRKWTVEPWIKRQWLKYNQWEDTYESHLKTNPKLAFAREMQELEAGLGVLDGLERQQRCYDLAVRYAQTTFTGDCWFIMRDMKSVNDTLRANETDLQAKARTLLATAAQTTDKALRRKALFALAYSGLYSEQQWWYTEEWDNNAYKYIRVPRPQAMQFKAFATLADYDRGGQAKSTDYVSRCDEYKQFIKKSGMKQ